MLFSSKEIITHNKMGQTIIAKACLGPLSCRAAGWVAVVKMQISDVVQKRSAGCLELTSQIWTGVRAMGASIALHSVWFRDWTWRKMMGITQYLPNKKLTFQSHFNMLRMKFNTLDMCHGENSPLIVLAFKILLLSYLQSTLPKSNLFGLKI